MSIGGGVALIVIGAILRFAVTYHAKWVNIQAIGVILMIGGAAGLVASIALVVYRRRERAGAEVVERRRDGEPPRCPGPPRGPPGRAAACRLVSERASG